TIIVTGSLYLYGLLNSKVLDFVMHQISSTKQGGYFEYKPMYLAQLPIRTIDFDNPADVAMHDKMVELVDEMLKRHKQLPSLTGEGRKIAERVIETVDGEIDALVYRLYGLSADEVAIVESGRRFTVELQGNERKV
ncbi:MAG: restriction endonuclease subunit R, partial [Chloroflexota bacterium]|nr:restriction endonuclease subunit R [Chloroflexota bacterium]